MTQRRVWVVSELYYPEETSTGFLLTRIAEGLAGAWDVRVICGQPTYSGRGQVAPRRETRHGVRIERSWSTTLDKNRLGPRLANALTISATMFIAGVRSFRRGDAVLVVTNPPFLPFLITFAAWLRRARTVLIVHDVYPEVLTTAGLVGRRSLLARAAGWLTTLLYEAVDRIVVLGRDMRALAISKLGRESPKVAIIPNWADLDQVRPSGTAGQALLRESGLQHHFVVQYAGNMGRTHDLESIIEAARLLACDDEVHFLLLGGGAKLSLVEEAVRSVPLSNVTLLGQRPRSEQHCFLNACDVALITFTPGMAGVSVPSRMYNVMAAGKPIIAMADPESELAHVIKEHDIGWVVAPQDVQGLVAAIRDASGDRASLQAMGRRARRAAEEHYALDHAVVAYRGVVSSLLEA